MHDLRVLRADARRAAPIVLPPIPGTIDENDFGEFGTRFVIYQHPKPRQAIRASNGCGWRSIRARQNAYGPRARVGHRVGAPGDASKFVVAMDAVIRNRSTSSRASSASDGFSIRRRTTSKWRFATDGRPVRVVRRRAGGVEHEPRRLREGQGHAAVTLPAARNPLPSDRRSARDADSPRRGRAPGASSTR